ncbi:MAG: hypothetical protein ACYC35_09335 [Pirellulales bacterium]
MVEMPIGHVSHYFGKLGVAGIELTDGDLNVGETIHVKGHTSDFVQKVESLEIDHHRVEHSVPGDDVGVRVAEHVREHDTVFKVVE